MQNNLHSYRFLCLVCTYTDVLELITPVSKVFEGDGLLANELKPALTQTLENIDEEDEVAGTDDEMLTSHLSQFKVREDQTIECSFIVSDDKHKHNIDKARIEVKISEMIYSEKYRMDASTKKKAVLKELKDLLQERFSDLSSPVFENIKWYNPKQWSNNRTYGIDQLTVLVEHFKEPLSHTKFDAESLFREWKLFRTFVNANYRSLEAQQMWEKIFQYKRDEFPNLVIVASLVMVMAGSNSTVERAFSLLTLMLTDRRLSLAHDTIKDILTININDKLWTPQEREEIIKTATSKYENAKRRVRTFDDTSVPAAKIPRIEVNSSSDEGESDYSDSDSENEEI